MCMRWNGNTLFEDENRPVNISVPGCVVQSVICLSADKEVASSIPSQSHTFLQIDMNYLQRPFSSF